VRIPGPIRHQLRWDTPDAPDWVWEPSGAWYVHLECIIDCMCRADAEFCKRWQGLGNPPVDFNVQMGSVDETGHGACGKTDSEGGGGSGSVTITIDRVKPSKGCTSTSATVAHESKHAGDYQEDLEAGGEPGKSSEEDADKEEARVMAGPAGDCEEHCEKLRPPVNLPFPSSPLY